MEVPGQRPRTKLSPTVQHACPDAGARGSSAAVQRLQLPEFVRDLLDVILKIREILGQVQISAKTDSLHGHPQQRPAYPHPVFFSVRSRISALHKGRRTAQPDREQIGMQPDLMGRCIHP